MFLGTVRATHATGVVGGGGAPTTTTTTTTLTITATATTATTTTTTTATLRLRLGLRRRLYHYHYHYDYWHHRDHDHHLRIMCKEDCSVNAQGDQLARVIVATGSLNASAPYIIETTSCLVLIFAAGLHS